MSVSSRSIPARGPGSPQRRQLLRHSLLAILEHFLEWRGVMAVKLWHKVRNGRSLLARPSRAPNAMNVRFKAKVGHIVLNDKLNVIDVNAAPRHIGRKHDIALSA